MSLGLALFALLVALVTALLLIMAGQQNRDRARRWARVAQRRAPLRAADTPYGVVLRHVDEQIDILLSERRRIESLLVRGRKLRGMMERSPQMRPRVPSLERVLAYLQDKGRKVDALIGRYYQHRDNLKIVLAAEAFSRDLEAYEAGGSSTDPYGRFQVETDALDEETERLLLVAEAEDELNALLRAG